MNRKEKRTNILKSPVALLLYRLLTALFLLSISRWMIYLFNIHIFHKLAFNEALHLYFVGLRFDLCVLAYLNIPLILAYTLPLPFFRNKTFQKVIGIVYVALNSIAVILNLVDVVYFRYIGKRMTTEMFQFLGNRNENFGLLGQFANDFWYIIVAAIVFTLVLVVVAKETHIRQEGSQTLSKSALTTNYLAFIFIGFLTVIACRGGFQNKPINLATSLKYTNTDNVPIVINTPFSIVKSGRLQKLEMMDIVENPSYTPIHYDNTADRFARQDTVRQNVVIIILESIGQETIKYYNTKRNYTITPFLDSLLGKSLTFEGYANGRRSIESLPSILAGIPSLMEADFVSSPYFSNHIDGIGSHLKEHGYRTAFFHGGNNGTMNFDAFSLQAGFDEYYGRDEYANDADYDRRWGIFDGPFMQYAAHKMSEFDTCFAAVVYTLSSHHPFTLPKDFVLPDKSNQWTGFEKTVYYTDCALRDFFGTAQKEPWFDNTLFVVTADHANTEHLYPEYSTIIGMYAVPIAFYGKNIAPHRCDEMAQQTDIGISTLSAVGINDTIFTFGRNLFNKNEKPSFISYINQTYQYSNGEYLIQTDGQNTLAIYRYKDDRMLRNDLSEHINCNDVGLEFKERLQEYNNRMILNQLYYERDTTDEFTTDTIVHN